MRAGEAVTLVARTRRGPGLPTLPGQAREMSVKRRLTPKRERETPEYAAEVAECTRRVPAGLAALSERRHV